MRACLDLLGARRIGHGVRAVEDRALLGRIADAGVVLEVCPTSNVALGVWERERDVPLGILREAGVAIALGADDPLLFGSRLAAQYDLARHVHGFDDEDLAGLARSSVTGSAAPPDVRVRLLDGIDRWVGRPR